MDENIDSAPLPYGHFVSCTAELPTDVKRQIQVGTRRVAAPFVLGRLCDDRVRADLDRTFPEHANFRPGEQGYASLRRVLEAYALYNPDIGYLQSMNFIAAFLLLVFGYDDEEAAFWGLHRMVAFSLKGYFALGMKELKDDTTVFDHLLQVHHTELYNHLQAVGCLAWPQRERQHSEL